MSGLFFVLTLAAYVRYARKTRSVGRYLTVLLLFSLGLLSKPMLVTTLFVLLFLDYWPLRRFAQPSAIGRIFLEKIPLLALSAASAVATFLAHKQAIASVGELGLSWRLSNMVVSCLTYLWQMIWPVRLAPFYPHLGNQLPLWEIMLAALLIISISGAAFLLRKRQPYFFTGWFWYLVMPIPVLGVIQPDKIDAQQSGVDLGDCFG